MGKDFLDASGVRPLTKQLTTQLKANDQRRAAQTTGTLSGPGIGEQFFNKTQGFYTNPTASNQYFQSAQSVLGQPASSASYLNDPNVANYFSNPSLGQTAYGNAANSLYTQGAGERRANQLAGQMTQPGIGTNFAQTALSGNAGKMGNQNQAQQAWMAFNQNKPTLASDPGLDPYYENAKRRAAESIGQKTAAQGVYGSSAAADNIAESMTNLEAERANREAQYNLSRLAEQRGWEGLGGELAGQAANSQLGWMQGMGNLGLSADQQRLAGLTAGANTGLAAQQLGLNRTLGGLNAASNVDQTALAKILGGGQLTQSADAATLARLLGGGQLAQGADTMDLGRVLGGQGSASGAQVEKETSALNQRRAMMDMLDRALPLTSGSYQNMFTNDQALMDAVFGTQLGGGTERIRGSQANKESQMLGMGNAMDMFSSMYGMGNNSGKR